MQYGQINEKFSAAIRNWPEILIWVFDAEEYCLTEKTIEYVSGQDALKRLE